MANKLPAIRRRKEDDEPIDGPAMRALPPDVTMPDGRVRSWKNFVRYLFLVPPAAGASPGRGATEAARLSGWGLPTSNDVTMRAQAWRLRHDPRVQLAIQEELQKHIRGAAPEVLNRLLNVAHDPMSKDHVRAIGMLLDRAAPVTTVHQVTVEHKSDLSDPDTLVQLCRYLKSTGATREGMISKFGHSLAPMIDRVLNEKEPIDATFEEVEPDPDEDDITIAAKTK